MKVAVSFGMAVVLAVMAVTAAALKPDSSISTAVFCNDILTSRGGDLTPRAAFPNFEKGINA